MPPPDHRIPQNGSRTTVQARHEWIQETFGTLKILQRTADMPDLVAKQKATVARCKESLQEQESELADARAYLAAGVSGPNKEAREAELQRLVAADPACRDLRGAILTCKQDLVAAEIELQRLEQEWAGLQTRSRLIGHELSSTFPS